MPPPGAVAAGGGDHVGPGWRPLHERAEEFDYYTVSDVLPSGSYLANGSINDIRITTKNEMVGPQVGALVEFYTEGRWWIDLEGKVSLMSNSLHESTDYRSVRDNVVTEYTSSASAHATSVLSDANITCIYRWSRHLTTRLGYRAIWMNNLTLAQDNFSTDINVYRAQVSQMAGLSSASTTARSSALTSIGSRPSANCWSAFRQLMVSFSAVPMPAEAAFLTTPRHSTNVKRCGPKNDDVGVVPRECVPAGWNCHSCTNSQRNRNSHRVRTCFSSSRRLQHNRRTK